METSIQKKKSVFVSLCPDNATIICHAVWIQESKIWPRSLGMRGILCPSCQSQRHWSKVGNCEFMHAEKASDGTKKGPQRGQKKVLSVLRSPVMQSKQQFEKDLQERLG